MKHLQALDAIAKANQNSRTAANGGFNASLEYVLQQLSATDYTIE